METPSPKAIAVIDVSGSTRLYHDEGNSVAHQVVRDFLNRAGQTVTNNSGRIVKFLGDGFFALFSDPQTALKSCAKVHEHADGQSHGLTFRIGLHFGEIIETEDDAFGDAINVAFRVADYACSGQITVIDQSLSLFANNEGENVRLIGAVSLSGQPGTYKLYDIRNLAILAP